MSEPDEVDRVHAQLAVSLRGAVLAHEQEGEALDELRMLLAGRKREGQSEIHRSWRDRLGKADSAGFVRIMRRQVALIVLGMIAAATVMFSIIARFVPAR